MVTFASSEKGLLDPARQRIRRGERSHYRGLYPGFFLYAVLDLLVDQHLDFLDEIRDRLMLIKETLSEQPDRQLLKEVFRLIKK